MTQPTGNCPNCGAKIVFRWSSSVQTVCEYCKSILVRTDVDLKKVGQVADLPPDSSPIQIGTEGAYNHKAFTAIGRIIYEYEQGSWNEWHLMMNDGTSGWLSDAQDEYAVSFAAPGRKLPEAGQCKVGQNYVWDNQRYSVTTITERALSRRAGRIAVSVLGQEGRGVRRSAIRERKIRHHRLQRRAARALSGRDGGV